jgi:acetolactate synthase-1/2/3 large subunit
MARTPILALTGAGSNQTRYKNFYQEVDQYPIFSGLTKMSARVETSSRLPELLGQAIRVATTGSPGPVHLELVAQGGALDVELAEEPPPPDARYAFYPPIRYPAPADDVKAALAAIAKAKRPLIVADEGIRNSQAAAALRAFSQKLKLPVATSLDAKAAMMESDPLYVGVVGRYSRDVANIAMQEADFVIFVGSTTGSMPTLEWSLPKPGIAAIQIDNDPRELGRNYPLTVGLLGDVKTVLEQLTAAATGSPPDRSAWLTWITALRADWLAAWKDKETADVEPIKPQRICRALCDALPDDALMLVDTGHTAVWAARHMYFDKPGQSLLRCAGSLGWAFPASLGAKCGQPDRPVISFVGDGAFLYHVGELETQQRYGINTITVINNNNSYSQERNTWKDEPDYLHHWDFKPVSFADVGKGFGTKVLVVEKARDIGPAFKEALKANAPVIIEVIADAYELQTPAWPRGGPVPRPFSA